MIPYNVSNEGNEGNPLAPDNGSGIMGEGAQGENAGGAGDAGKLNGQTAETVELIDGFEVFDGKVGGKIPVDAFRKARQSSIKNPEARVFTLGKFTPTTINGVADWSKPGQDSYIVRAGNDSAYFSLGNEWAKIQEMYNLNDDEMFKYFNIPALNYAIASKKTIRFSHNPLDYSGCALVDEWEYLKEALT